MVHNLVFALSIAWQWLNERLTMGLGKEEGDDLNSVKHTPLL
jgi:hypothetical protein